jgi:glutamate 5-kinase
VQGRFGRGDAVVVRNTEGREIARGLVAYDMDDTKLIAGHRSNEMEAILGTRYRGRGEVIHRDDLVLTGGGLLPND